MDRERTKREQNDQPGRFPGFPDFASNVTFTPIQFFTVALPYSSRGCVRIVGHMIRKILGWVDERGNPTNERLCFSYREITESAGVSHETIPDAIEEAIQRNFIRCLAKPRADEPGKAARSGIYELKWDLDGDYTDNPETFRGFFYPEAAVITAHENGTSVQRAKAARKNIPNAFFDYLLPRERLSVIRTVGALLFYSIQWSKGGERRQDVSFSITELANLTKMSRQHVHKALAEAVEVGYVERVSPGFFNTANSHLSEPATYGIHWAKGAQQVTSSSPTPPPELRLIVTTNAVPSQPVQTSEQTPENRPPLRKGERRNLGHLSEKVNEEPLRKGERHLSEKVNEDLSEKVTTLSIKRSIKTLQTTAADPNPTATAQKSTAAAVFLNDGVSLLVEAGFDQQTAEHLACASTVEVIRNQIAWLPKRKAKANRLGLLRRSIEENWPEPEGIQGNGNGGAGEEFARHYYAAYNGNSGSPVTRPFSTDCATASELLIKLGCTEANGPAAELGRAFGKLVRAKHNGDPRAKPFLTSAIVLYGDEFALSIQRTRSTRQRMAQEKAKEAHYAANSDRYQAYLRQAEISLQRSNAALYGAFLEEREKSFDSMRQFGVDLSRFQTDQARLAAFAQFFAKNAEYPVLGFWEWDCQLNEQGFTPQVASA